VQDDLWLALTQQASVDNITLPVDVKTIMDTWTLKMGYPVVTVLRNYGTGSAVVTQVTNRSTQLKPSLTMGVRSGSQGSC